MNRSVFPFLRHIGIALAIGIIVCAASGQSSLALSDSTDKARSFLVKLVDTDLELLPEYRGATVYWPYHDNYLAAKKQEAADPEPTAS